MWTRGVRITIAVCWPAALLVVLLAAMTQTGPLRQKDHAGLEVTDWVISILTGLLVFAPLVHKSINWARFGGRRMSTQQELDETRTTLLRLSQQFVGTEVRRRGVDDRPLPLRVAM